MQINKYQQIEYNKDLSKKTFEIIQELDYPK